MNGPDPQKDFLEKAKATLDATTATAKMDASTRESLARIRLEALALAGKKERRFPLHFRWITAGGFASATVAAVGLFFWLNGSPGEFPTRQMENFEIAASPEQIDLFYEDLDFYRWVPAIETGATPRKTS